MGAPPDATEMERWICSNSIVSIRVEFRQTGTDTSETYLILTTAGGKKACWSEGTFRRHAELKIGTTTIASPHRDIAEKVRARIEWESKNAKELAEYKRLKAKFEKGDE